MYDVARLASVSIATVSHVINGTRFVSAERVERVQAAMQELGYSPDATARSLRVGRTHTIGLVIPKSSSSSGGEASLRARLPASPLSAARIDLQVAERAANSVVVSP